MSSEGATGNGPMPTMPGLYVPAHCKHKPNWGDVYQLSTNGRWTGASGRPSAEERHQSDEGPLASQWEGGNEVEISAPRSCDLCKQIGIEREARYDGKTKMGPWANMCEDHFLVFGVSLGTGKGQRLVVKK